jgi:methylglutaconyl-CoA hydratase
MSNIEVDVQNKLLLITFNRIDKHNAFDDYFLKELQAILEAAQEDNRVRVILITANGQHFSAGADLNWMQRMASFSQEENYADAMILAKLMHTLYQSSKPTLACVHGFAIGGGAGLVAACDIAIAAENARFCFSEVKLGLIPAVISPYVIQAIGERAAKAYFMSAETFSANRAQQIGLVHEVVVEETLLSYCLEYATNLAHLAPEAVRAAKKLVCDIANQAISQTLLEKTAALIAQKRVSVEGQKGLQAFLNKETPVWDEQLL